MKTAAERMREYRARRKEGGLPPPKDTRTWAERKARAEQGVCKPPKSGKSGRSKYDAAKKYLAKRFVAIDTEGVNVSGDEHFVVEDHLNECDVIGTFRRHRTFLMMASDTERTLVFGSEKKRPLNPMKMLDWLVALPQTFGKGCIYISFAFSYDVAQLLRGFTGKDLVRIHQQRSRSGEAVRGVYVKDYYIGYQRGKKFSVAKLDESGKKITSTVVIYDVFGFFHCSLLSAIRDMPGCVTPEEKAIIERGKQQRTDFQTVPYADILEYTQAELFATCRMLVRIREACARLGLRLKYWTGAGAIAAAMLEAHNVTDHYEGVTAVDPSEPLEWAFHAYFGGRIELFRYGLCKQSVYEYDIASAYPAAQVELPSMRGGRWVYHPRPTGEMLSTMSVVSLVRVVWRCYNNILRIGPLPYRTEHGSVYYPTQGQGIYCVEEVRAALSLPENARVAFRLEAVWEFIPATDAKPFAFLRDYYLERQRLVAAYKQGADYDLVEKILKLGLNSAYGKLAQTVGGGYSERYGWRPPKFANPWYAAAITAAIRAKMLRAAYLDRQHIVMIATDGIYSTRPLPLSASREKELGGWEEQTYDRGVYAQSGVYWERRGEKWQVAKTRGMRKSEAQASVAERVIEAWERGEDSLACSIVVYVTLGMAVRSPDWNQHLGSWMTQERELALRPAGTKRQDYIEQPAPERGLVPTIPAFVPDSMDVLSYPRVPRWMAVEYGDDEDSSEAQAKFGDDND